MRLGAWRQWWRGQAGGDWPAQTDLWLTLLAALALVALGANHVFFWDTIQLASKQADYFYHHPAAFPLLPDRLDSGHPPGFGGYLALWWTWLGRSLWVSHLAMLPFIWLLFYQAYRLADSLGGGLTTRLVLLVVVADPVLLGQLMLVSPDVALAAFFLLGLRGSRHNRTGWIAAAVLGLSVVSLRGMMVGVALYLADLSWRISQRPAASWPATAAERLWPYLPGGLVGLAFLVLHHQAKGWVGFHADSPWAPSFARVGLLDFCKNVVILGWRLLDFGRVFVWLALATALWRLKPRWLAWWRDDEILRFLVLTLAATALVLTPTLLIYQGLLNHRYLLPVFLSLGLLAGYLFSKLQLRQERLALGLVAGLGLALGNLWIYPDHISQGWDSTLAHLPYYTVRRAALHTIEQQGIPLESIGTAFPEIGPLDERDLRGRTDGMAPKDLASQQFIYYSNVMNDFTDAELEELKSRWKPLFTVRMAGVRAVLYQRPPTPPNPANDAKTEPH